MSDFPDAHFGTSDSKPVDWRKTDDPDPDDEEIETPKDVVMMLGFDPAKEAETNQGGPSSKGTSTMTEEEKKAAEAKEREDKAKKDASAGAEPDNTLSRLDAFMKRHDARMDAIEAREKARSDAEEARERADAQARRDAERAEWMKADVEGCARDDAEEAKECAELEGKGEPKHVAADKARKDRRDRMDARRKDAESIEDKAKKDAAEKLEREDAARKDAQAVDDRARADRIAKDAATIAAGLANMPMRADAADYAGFADAQARADSAAYQPLGMRAPGPMQAETLAAYRARLARGVQKHSKPWSGVDLHTLQDAAFNIAEGQIYADAAVAALSTDDLPEDALIKTTRVDPESGHRVTEFRGRHTFIRGLKRPTLRATEFMTGKGR